MHLYVGMKGIKQDVDKWVTMLQGVFLPYPTRTIDNQIVQSQVQLSIRPIQLYEIGFPKECKDIVCATILGAEGGKLRGNDGNKPCEYTFFNWVKEKLGRLLGLQPIGEYKTDMYLPCVMGKGAVATIGLGIKEDYIMENGNEGL